MACLDCEDCRQRDKERDEKDARIKELEARVKEITIARDIVYHANEGLREAIGGHGMEIEVGLLTEKSKLLTRIEEAENPDEDQAETA